MRGIPPSQVEGLLIDQSRDPVAAVLRLLVECAVRSANQDKFDRNQRLGRGNLPKRRTLTRGELKASCAPSRRQHPKTVANIGFTVFEMMSTSRR